MMKATELRIGNFVRINKRIVKVESLDSSGINIEACGGYYPGDCSIEHDAYFEKWNSSIKQVTPITLTEEWLLKFGFEETGNQNFEITIKEFGNRKISFTKMMDEWGLGLIFNDGKRVPIFPTNIYFVHQLQNLYFALTGEELKLS